MNLPHSKPPFQPEHYKSVLKTWQKHPGYVEQKSVRVLLDILWQKFFRTSAKSLTDADLAMFANRIADEFKPYEGHPDDSPLAYLTKVCKSIAMDATSLAEIRRHGKKDKYKAMLLDGASLPKKDVKTGT